jgi:hypothetical protein
LRGPALGGGGGKRGRIGQGDAAPAERAEHAVDQLARTAIDQRQHGGDRGMAGRAESEHLCQRDAQREPRLGVIGQGTLSRRIDHGVEIGQMPQHFGGDRAGQRAVVVGADARERASPSLLDRLAPPQHRVEQAKRRLARRDAGGQPGILGLVHA